MTAGGATTALSYVVPLRRWSVGPHDELGAYLRRLGEQADVTVVDGSDESIFVHNARYFSPPVRHLRVDTDLAGRYGKVLGVITGVRAAKYESVVIADDDVRYDSAALMRIAELLGEADLVRPQNYFDPLPWHARWDTARSLLNRAFTADYPGTLGVRRSCFLEAGAYDAECLFENLELIRTIEAAGGRTVAALDLYVRRVPASAGHFWSQRVRQAYDDFAIPVRMAAELAVLPVAAGLLARRRGAFVLAGSAATAAVAELGRRRAGGAAVFPASCSLFAPLWVAERGLCAWLAVWTRVVRGGVPYAGTVIAKAANPRRELRRRFDSSHHPHPLVSPVA